MPAPAAQRLYIVPQSGPSFWNHRDERACTPEAQEIPSTSVQLGQSRVQIDHLDAGNIRVISATPWPSREDAGKVKGKSVRARLMTLVDY